MNSPNFQFVKRNDVNRCSNSTMVDGILIDLAIVIAVVGIVIFIEFVEDVEAEERADD